MTDQQKPPSAPPDDAALDVAGAATFLKLHQETIRRMARRGIIGAQPSGPRGPWRFSRAELVRLMNPERLAPTAAAPSLPPTMVDPPRPTVHRLSTAAALLPKSAQRKPRAVVRHHDIGPAVDDFLAERKKVVNER